MSTSRSSMTLEKITRPFVVIDSRPAQVVAPTPVTDLGTVPAAQVTWGETSQFILPLGQRTQPVVGDYTSNPGGNFGGLIDRLEDRDSIFDDDEFEFVEESRTVEMVRVYNPEEALTVLDPKDRTMWVDVERITSITFRSPEGHRHVYKLNHDPETLP